MHNCPLVSVIVPVYGVEKYIGECVDSIFSQTYPNIEVIFVNDCTKDKSRVIIEQIITEREQHNAIIIDNERNLGSAQTRNEGLNIATGEYVCFVDSDDILPKHSIATMVNVAMETCADIVRGNILRFNDISAPQPFSNQHPSNIIAFRRALLDWGLFPLGVWGGLYKRSLFTSNGISFFKGLNFGEDFGVTARLAYFAEIVSIVPDAVYKYRINSESMTQKFTEKNANDLMDISNRIKEFYESKCDYQVYKDAMERGRARIKTITLLQLSPDISPKYKRMFPDLSQANLPFKIRIKLWSIEHNYRTLYKILHRIIGKV